MRKAPSFAKEVTLLFILVSILLSFLISPLLGIGWSAGSLLANYQRSSWALLISPTNTIMRHHTHHLVPFLLSTATVALNCLLSVTNWIIPRAPVSSLAQQTSFLLSLEWRRRPRHGGGMHVSLSSIAPTFQSSLHGILIPRGASNNDNPANAHPGVIVGNNQESRRMWVQQFQQQRCGRVLSIATLQR